MAKIVKKLKSGRKGKADGGNIKDPLSAKAGLYNSLGNVAGDFINDSITSFIPEGTDWRKNPLGDLKKKDSLTTAGSIGSSTAKGAGTGAAIGTFLLPGIGTGVGAALGAGIGAIGSGVKSLFTSKKKKEERKTNEMNWATGMSSLASADNSVGSYKEGGEKEKKGRTVLVPGKYKDWDENLKIDDDWISKLKKSKDINELDSTRVGTYKGNDLLLSDLRKMPKEVNNYYNTEFSYHSQLKNLGLENNFDELNMKKSPKSTEGTDVYMPISTITRDGNKAAYIGDVTKGLTTSKKPGMAKGGKVEGAGTAKSDSIDKRVEDGSFIVPAENAEKAMQYGKSYLNWKGDESANRKYPGTEVALSNGEVLFTPEESDILRYHGIDLDALAPNADNDKEMKNGGDKFSKYTTEEYAEILASGKTPDETPDRSIFDKIMDFAPEAAGALQIGAAARGNQKAGEMPDINVSESLRSLAAETRKEAEYGLEPGAKAAMLNQTEKARRDATNAIVGKGGSATSMMSNLQSVLSTTIDKKYNIELTDAAEKARKKSLYYGAKTKLGDQELDVKKFAMDNWRGLQEVNAGLLSAGIGNIVGARKLKKEMDLMKEIGSDKATFTI